MQEDGFEYKLPGDDQATFFRWRRGYGAKDLMLIDRITGGMPLIDFEEALREGSLTRGPLMLAMMATSIRAELPDWSVERILKAVDQIDVTENIEFIGGEEDEPAVPPADGGGSSDSSDSSSAASKSSATPAATSA